MWQKIQKLQMIQKKNHKKIKKQQLKETQCQTHPQI